MKIYVKKSFDDIIVCIKSSDAPMLISGMYIDTKVEYSPRTCEMHVNATTTTPVMYMCPHYVHSMDNHWHELQVLVLCWFHKKKCNWLVLQSNENCPNIPKNKILEKKEIEI